MQKRTKPIKAFSMDLDALSFLEDYAQARGIKLSPALSELILHVADQDKTNPKLVKKALAVLQANDT